VLHFALPAVATLADARMAGASVRAPAAHVAETLAPSAEASGQGAA